MSAGAIIVAAGRGERLGLGLPKGLIEINGVPLLMFSTLAFESSPSINSIVLVVPSGFEEIVLELSKKFEFGKVVAAVAGGVERQDSVVRGLEALPAEDDCAIIHDGARPFVSSQLIEAVTASLRTHKAAFAALPVSDTLHQNKGGIALEGPDRSVLAAAQTPQGFHRQILTEAMQLGSKRNEKYTDEVSLLRKTLHINAAIVPGDSGNIKITRSQDIDFYCCQLQQAAISLMRRSA